MKGLAFMKMIRTALIALLLTALLAVPGFAEPAEDTTASAVELTNAAGEPIEPTQPVVTTTEPTTIGIVPIAGGLEDDLLLIGEIPAPTPLEYIEAHAISFAALAVSVLALLFSVVALAKTKKKSGHRRMKNYF